MRGGWFGRQVGIGQKQSSLAADRVDAITSRGRHAVGLTL